MIDWATAIAGQVDGTVPPDWVVYTDLDLLAACKVS